MRGTLSACALCWLVAGCEAGVASGAGCTRNSECAEGLACADGRCRDACGDSRDCTAGSSCVTFRGLGICVPPSQPVPCVFNSDCGASFCRSGVCVGQCTSDHDCERGTCAAGLCSEPLLTPASPDTGAPNDASPDAGTATQCAAHQTYCQTDARCHDLASDTSACGQCGLACPAGGACESSVCVCDGAPCAPANDHCPDAIEITLDANGRGSGIGSFAGATADIAPCFGIVGADIFFRVRLTQRSVVSAIAQVGFEPDIQDHGCGVPSSDCGSLCTQGSGHAVDAALMEPGDVFIALRSEAASTMSSVVSVVVVPVGDLDITALVPTIGIHGGESPSATEPVTATTWNAGCASGPAHAFYWVRCGVITTQTLGTCSVGGSGLVLEELTTPHECLMADATGCVNSMSDTIEGADVVVVHAASGSVHAAPVLH